MEEALRALKQDRATLDEKSLLAVRDLFEDRAASVTDVAGYDLVYHAAQAELCLSVAYEFQHSRKPGEKALERALKWAQKAAQLKPSSAEIHSLLADLWGRKIASYGDIFTGMDCGPKVGDENKKALQLAPDDPLVQASLGRQYYFAPSAFGGDLKKAALCFKRSLDLDPDSDETWYWLAMTYHKLKDLDGCEKALRKALELCPQNVRARYELDHLWDKSN
jgi:tetratricopeptide (TPR) repeat protein